MSLFLAAGLDDTAESVEESIVAGGFSNFDSAHWNRLPNHVLLGMCAKSGSIIVRLNQSRGRYIDRYR